MFKIHEIREMIKLVDGSSLEKFEWKNGDVQIKIKKQGGPTAVTVAAPQVVQVPVAEVKPVAKTTPVAVAPAAAPVQTAPVQQETVQAPPAAASRVNDENLHKIVSPMVGTFYSAPSEDAPAYVKPGDKVDSSSIVCIVEAMKLFNEIEAEVKGEIVEVLVKNAQLVELGQPLFLVKPE